MKKPPAMQSCNSLPHGLTPPNAVKVSPSPGSPAARNGSGRAFHPMPFDVQEMRETLGTSRYWQARLYLYWMLGPSLVKVLWLHMRYSQHRQFARLGNSPRSWSRPLPAAWPLWVGDEVRRFIASIPWIRRRSCYWRSQVLFDLLPRFGFPAEMHFGTARSDQRGVAVAHVWVTSNDLLLADSCESVEPYVELISYIRPAPL